jgi:UDP-glucose 4-epimerase
MKVLVTGATGYIGSHFVRRLALERPDWTIAGVDLDIWRQNDVRPYIHADNLFQLNLAEMEGKVATHFDAIVHFAAFISVEESVKFATAYYLNNILSTRNLLRKVHCDHFIFASTGTAFQPSNPYAQSKVVCEDIVRDAAGNRDGYTIFRFYNVSGLAPDLRPTGQPTHLIRRAALAAAMKIPELVIAGDDWETRDGTCVRDYIHVEDVVSGVLQALYNGPENTPYECLGTGQGYTVKEVVEVMRQISRVNFNVRIGPRRAGDVASMLCPSTYHRLQVKHTLEDMCLSAFQEADHD